MSNLASVPIPLSTAAVGRLEPVRMSMRLKEWLDRYHFDDVNFKMRLFTKAGRVEAWRPHCRVRHEDYRAGPCARTRIRLPDHVGCDQQSGFRLLSVSESGSN